MKKLLSILILFTCFSYIYGQEDSLYSCGNLGEVIKKFNTYNRALERTLSNKYNDDFIIRYSVKPAFDPEYSFQIEEVNDKNYVLKTMEFKQNLWNTIYCDSTKTVDYNYEQKNLNPELKAQIYRLFEHVISSLTSRYYSGVGEGGITYNFYIKLNDTTIDCSETWSPTKNSTSYKLVQICEEVMKHASNDSIKKEDIVDKIEKFMK